MELRLHLNFSRPYIEAWRHLLPLAGVLVTPAEITENRLNILSEAEVIKANEQTGGLLECDLGHGRPIEHG